VGVGDFGGDDVWPVPSELELERGQQEIAAAVDVLIIHPWCDPQRKKMSPK